MSGLSTYPQYARDWKPGLFMGSGPTSCRRSEDPREELAAWADSALGPMVAVPVALLRAAAELRVCRATTTLTHDEDGPVSPMTIHCRKPEGHLYDHHNGYCGWSER